MEVGEIRVSAPEKLQQDDTEKKSGRQTEKIGFPEGHTGSSLSTGTDNSKINEKYQTIFTPISHISCSTLIPFLEERRITR